MSIATLFGGRVRTFAITNSGQFVVGGQLGSFPGLGGKIKNITTPDEYQAYVENHIPPSLSQANPRSTRHPPIRAAWIAVRDGRRSLGEVCRTEITKQNCRASLSECCLAHDLLMSAVRNNEVPGDRNFEGKRVHWHSNLYMHFPELTKNVPHVRIDFILKIFDEAEKAGVIAIGQNETFVSIRELRQDLDGQNRRIVHAFSALSKRIEEIDKNLRDFQRVQKLTALVNLAVGCFPLGGAMFANIFLGATTILNEFGACALVQSALQIGTSAIQLGTGRLVNHTLSRKDNIASGDQKESTLNKSPSREDVHGNSDCIINTDDAMLDFELEFVSVVLQHVLGFDERSTFCHDGSIDYALQVRNLVNALRGISNYDFKGGVISFLLHSKDMLSPEEWRKTTEAKKKAVKDEADILGLSIGALHWKLSVIHDYLPSENENPSEVIENPAVLASGLRSVDPGISNQTPASSVAQNTPTSVPSSSFYDFLEGKGVNKKLVRKLQIEELASLLAHFLVSGEPSCFRATSKQLEEVLVNSFYRHLVVGPSFADVEDETDKQVLRDNVLHFITTKGLLKEDSIETARTKIDEFILLASQDLDSCGSFYSCRSR